MAGGALFGFVGILISVPVAAVVSVFISFALEQYRKSAYFSGRIGKNDDAAPQKPEKDAKS